MVIKVLRERTPPSWEMGGQAGNRCKAHLYTPSQFNTNVPRFSVCGSFYKARIMESESTAVFTSKVSDIFDNKCPPLSPWGQVNGRRSGV